MSRLGRRLEDPACAGLPLMALASRARVGEALRIVRVSPTVLTAEYTRG